MVYLSVDSIQNGFALCENDEGEKIEIGLNELPRNVREGDIILVKSGGEMELDFEEKKRRQNKVALLLEKILKNNRH